MSARYLGQFGLGHVVGEEPEPVEGLGVPGGRRSLAVVLLVLMHHLSMQSLESNINNMLHHTRPDLQQDSVLNNN